MLSSAITQLQPRSKPLLIDLVAGAGVDTSDWANFKGGTAKAATNPKYCYDWSFVEPGKVVVLSLWYDQLESKDEEVFQKLNYRNLAAQLPKAAARGAWAKRSLAMDAACGLAFSRSLPVRVIICDGKRGNVVEDPTKSSKVELRMLDSVPWAVTAYDSSTGACQVTRGAAPLAIVDQFTANSAILSTPTRKSVRGEVFIRSSAVRANALARSNGFCEFCSQRGFLSEKGAVYLETHHIIPLSADGPDVEANVVALCPNDHRRAHYAHDADVMRRRLQAIVKAKLGLVR